MDPLLDPEQFYIRLHPQVPAQILVPLPSQQVQLGWLNLVELP
jgi:hypothetical protein